MKIFLHQKVTIGLMFLTGFIFTVLYFLNIVNLYTLICVLLIAITLILTAIVSIFEFNKKDKNI